MRHYPIALLIGLALVWVSGCRPEQEPAVQGSAVLMSVGAQEVREDEFRRAYRVFRAAYGAEADESPEVEQSSKIRFIHQLADELVLMAHARDTGVVVSDEGLRQAVEAIRGDYPDDLFDQMLLENAVNFEDWKEALRVRLTIDRLVANELAAKIRITEEDIAAYYRQQASGLVPPPSGSEGEGGDRIDQLLVTQLRRQKTEQAYGPWLEELRARYPVTIDQAVVHNIIADNGFSADDGEGGAP